MMANGRRTTLLVVAIAVLGACGSDGGGGDDADVTEEERPYYDAMVESFQSAEDDNLRLEDTQAECVSARWVRTIGVERFEQAGITPEAFSDDLEQDVTALGLDEAAAGQLYDAFGECDVEVLDQFVEAIAQGGDVSEEDLACLRENIDDALIRDILIVTFTQGEDALQGDQELTGRLLETFSACPGALPE